MDFFGANPGFLSVNLDQGDKILNSMATGLGGRIQILDTWTLENYRTCTGTSVEKNTGTFLQALIYDAHYC